MTDIPKLKSLFAIEGSIDPDKPKGGEWCVRRNCDNPAWTELDSDECRNHTRLRYFSNPVLINHEAELGVEWVKCAEHGAIGLHHISGQYIPSCGCTEYTVKVKKPIPYISVDIKGLEDGV